MNEICLVFLQRFSIYLRWCDNDDTFWDRLPFSLAFLSAVFHNSLFVESGHRVWPSLTVPLFHHLIEGRGFLGSARLCLVEWVQINMNIHEPTPPSPFLTAHQHLVAAHGGTAVAGQSGHLCTERQRYGPGERKRCGHL